METKLHLPLFTSLLETAVSRPAAALARFLRRARDAAGHQPLGANELRGMSELELRDLGIGRSEIPHALRGPDAQRSAVPMIALAKISAMMPRKNARGSPGSGSNERCGGGSAERSLIDAPCA